jgi:hypothetical protein
MMKPTVTILVSVLAAGLASAQSPSVIQNTRAAMNGVSNKQTAASNEALGIRQTPAPSSKVKASHVPDKSVAPAKPSLTSTKTSTKRFPVAHKHVVGLRAGIVGTTSASTATGSTNTSNPAEDAAAADNSSAAGGEGQNAELEQSLAPDSKYNANGRRDPFISPVVSKAGGSGCSTGKKCLEIGNINLRGVVHSESGFIAVVSNNMNKAYFLKENDPVFNGYVVKITGDSIVFQETLQDRLGKTFTREVVKKITTPAV